MAASDPKRTLHSSGHGGIVRRTCKPNEMRSPFIIFLALWIAFGSYAEARAIVFISYSLTRKRIPMNVGFALSVAPITAIAIYFAKHDTYHGVPEKGFEIYLWSFCAVAFVLTLAMPLIWRRGRKQPGGGAV